MVAASSSQSACSSSAGAHGPASAGSCQSSAQVPFPSSLSCSSILSSATSPTPIRAMLPQYSPANDFMRSSCGAGFPLFASAMYKNLGVSWANGTLASPGIASIPIPYVPYIYGERLRKMSKHARKDSRVVSSRGSSVSLRSVSTPLHLRPHDCGYQFLFFLGMVLLGEASV